MSGNRSPLVATMLFASALLSCAKTPFDGETPIVAGAIASRAPGEMSVNSGVGTSDCEQYLIVSFGTNVMVYQGGTRKDTLALAVGQQVSVFGQRSPVKTCPGFGHADGILLR